MRRRLRQRGGHAHRPLAAPHRPLVVDRDEHPRATSMEALAKLKPIVRADGTVTAGNASGVNDGAAALIIEGQVRAKGGLSPGDYVLALAAAVPLAWGTRAPLPGSGSPRPMPTPCGLYK